MSLKHNKTHSKHSLSHLLLLLYYLNKSARGKRNPQNAARLKWAYIHNSTMMWTRSYIHFSPCVSVLWSLNCCRWHYALYFDRFRCNNYLTDAYQLLFFCKSFFLFRLFVVGFCFHPRFCFIVLSILTDFSIERWIKYSGSPSMHNC